MCIITISVLCLPCVVSGFWGTFRHDFTPISVQSCPHQSLPKVLSKAPPSPDKTYSTIAQFSVFRAVGHSFLSIEARGIFSRDPFPLVRSFLSRFLLEVIMTLFSSRINACAHLKLCKCRCFSILINSSLLYGKLPKNQQKSPSR